MKEKLHITDHMADGGMLFLNGDDELLKSLCIERLHEMGYCRGKNINIRFYGTGENAYYRALSIKSGIYGTEYDFEAGGKILTHVSLAVPGLHMVLNSLAALAVAAENGVDLNKAAEALSEFRSLEGRGQVVENDGIKIINDAYNAAPQSMMAGLKVLDGTAPDDGGERIAVIADMLELGSEESRYHRELGDFIVKETRNIDRVLMYGKLTENTRDEIDKLHAAGKTKIIAEHYDSLEELTDRVLDIKKKGDVIFFKGSNSMKLWSIARELSGDRV